MRRLRGDLSIESLRLAFAREVSGRGAGFIQAGSRALDAGTPGTAERVAKRSPSKTAESAVQDSIGKAKRPERASDVNIFGCSRATLQRRAPPQRVWLIFPQRGETYSPTRGIILMKRKGRSLRRSEAHPASKGNAKGAGLGGVSLY